MQHIIPFIDFFKFSECKEQENEQKNIMKKEHLTPCKRYSEHREDTGDRIDF